jgi:hypothetical protein
MITTVRINVEKLKNSLLNYSTTVHLNEGSTYLDLKEKLYSMVNLDKSFEVDKSSIYVKNKEVKYDEVVSTENKILYNVTVK